MELKFIMLILNVSELNTNRYWALNDVFPSCHISHSSMFLVTLR